MIHVPLPYKHAIPPLRVLFDMVSAMHFWLQIKPLHGESTIALVHCTNGRNRTSIFVSCYLRYSGQFPTANDAFEFFIERRTGGDRSWITVTHKRYIRYFDELMDRLESLRSVQHSKQPKTLDEILQLPETKSLKPLPNPSGKLDLRKIVVHLGWSSADIWPLHETSSLDATKTLALEVHATGKLVWSSDINTEDTENRYQVLDGEIDFIIEDLAVSEDFQIRIVLQTISMHGSGATVQRSVTKIVLAVFYGNATFVAVDKRLRLRHVDVEIGTNINATRKELASGTAGKIGEAFWMDIIPKDVQDTHMLSTDLLASPDDAPLTGLSLHKIILNTVPRFNARDSCNPELELWRVGYSARRGGVRERELVYSTDMHRKFITNRLREGAASRSSLVTSSSRGSMASLQGSNESIHSNAFADSALQQLQNEDPVNLVDTFMILFRIANLTNPALNEDSLNLDPFATYEIKLFHIDQEMGARMLMIRFEFSPSLMAPGLIRIRPSAQAPLPGRPSITEDTAEDLGEEDEFRRQEEDFGGLELAGDPEKHFEEEISMDLIFSEVRLEDLERAFSRMDLQQNEVLFGRLGYFTLNG